MLEFKTIEDLRNSKELRDMGEYQHQEVWLDGKEVIACTTNQQYDDIIWVGIYEIIEKLKSEYDLENVEECDIASETRDFILEKLSEDYKIEFVNIYDEY